MAAASNSKIHLMNKNQCPISAVVYAVRNRVHSNKRISVDMLEMHDINKPIRCIMPETADREFSNLYYTITTLKEPTTEINSSIWPNIMRNSLSVSRA
jgi:hypothetical protein